MAQWLRTHIAVPRGIHRFDSCSGTRIPHAVEQLSVLEPRALQIESWCAAMKM